jgi:uncharacterized protein
METTFFSNKNNRVLGALALLMLIVALGAYAQYTFKQAEYLYSGPTTISVTGEGEATAIPDIGKFSFSVMAEGADAVKAREESNTKANAIIAFLKEKGVEEKDIKTESYNLYPKYKYEQKPCPMGSYCPGEQVQDGFEVMQTISVKVRNIDLAGDLVAGAGDKGATNLSGLEFTIDDTSVLEDEARKEAIADAKVKAEVLAKELNVELERMVGYYEEENGGPMPYYGMGGDMMVKTAMEESSVSPELPVGENTTKSRVTITYQIK